MLMMFLTLAMKTHALTCRERLVALESNHVLDLSRGAGPDLHLIAVKMKLVAAGLLGADLGRFSTSVQTTADARVYQSQYAVPGGRSITLFFSRDQTRVGHVLSANGHDEFVCAAGH